MGGKWKREEGAKRERDRGRRRGRDKRERANARLVQLFRNYQQRTVIK